MASVWSMTIFNDNFPLDVSKAPLEQQLSVAQDFWPLSIAQPNLHDRTTCAAFFSYLGREISAIGHHRQQFAFNTLDAMLDAIRNLETLHSEPLHEVIQVLSKKLINVDEKVIQRSLELCVRLWLTINVNSRPMFSLEIPLQWRKTDSLKALIEDEFKGRLSVHNRKIGLNIEGGFTAEYLINTCGMKLEWTDYLTDHLRMDPRRQVLTIYRHKVFLFNHLECEEDFPIPKDVLHEALDTLNLLFPFGHPPTRELLVLEDQHAFYDLGACGKDRNLDFSQYQYWRQELEDLMETFRSPPRTWKQLATDRRNLMEWAAFWVAVMVAFLTLISIPCNIIQATYSVKAYHATLAQGNNCPNV